MAINKFLARDHRFFIGNSLDGPFTELSGISTWGFSTDTNSEDISTVDNAGWGSNIATQRTATLTLEGFILVDAVTGERDPGQQAYIDAAVQVGFDAYRYFKVTAETTSGGEIGNMVCAGTPSLDEQGGTVTDVEPFGGEVQVDGRPVGSGIYSFFNY